MRMATIQSSYMPVLAMLFLLAIGGFFLIQKEDLQSRDTIRKHHLADIETALKLAKKQHGQFPPYDVLTWCGVISDPANKDLQNDIETLLRKSVDKYANLEKPFPIDPKESVRNYYYWKRSPAMFELYAVLEADNNGDRNTFSCPTGLHTTYDYGISSILREEQ